jgi:hypothetical protein
MSEEKKKRGVAWIAVLLIGLPVLYVASFGPAIWLTRTREPPLLAAVYWPLGWAAAYGPQVVRRPLAEYAGAFATPSIIFAERMLFRVPVALDDWALAVGSRH